MGNDLLTSAERHESAGDAIEGVWLRRLASLVERKGEAWVLESLGLGGPGEFASERLVVRRDDLRWLLTQVYNGFVVDADAPTFRRLMETI